MPGVQRRDCCVMTLSTATQARISDHWLTTDKWPLTASDRAQARLCTDRRLRHYWIFLIAFQALRRPPRQLWILSARQRVRGRSGQDCNYSNWRAATINPSIMRWYNVMSATCRMQLGVTWWLLSPSPPPHSPFFSLYYKTLGTKLTCSIRTKVTQTSSRTNITNTMAVSILAIVASS